MIYQKNKVKSAQTVPACPALLLALSPIESHSLESRLRSVGFDSLYVPLSTEEAITLSEQGQPDLVVMDIDFGGPLAGIKTGGILHEKLDAPVLYAARESQVDALSPILAAGGMGLLIDRLDLFTLRTTVQLLINQARIAKESQWRERRLLSLLASVGDAVLTVDRELNITFMNHQAEHITSHDNTESLSKNVFSILEFTDTEAETHARKLMQTILNEGIPDELPDPTALVGKYGEQLLIGDSIAPIVEDDLTISGLVIVFRSVAKRELAMKEQHRTADEARDDLSRSLAQAKRHSAELEAIMDAVPATAFVARDSESRLLMANRLACELFHLQPRPSNSQWVDSALDFNHFRVFREGKELGPDDLPVRSVALTGRPLREIELEVLFDNGNRHVFFGSAIPLLNEEGKPSGGVGAFMDITTRKAMEEALQRTNQDLEHFASAAAHDLHSPMGSCLRLARELSQSLGGRVDEDESTIMTLLVKALENLCVLTEDILIHAGWQEKAMVVVGLARPLDLALANLRDEIEVAQAQFEIGPLPSLPIDHVGVARVFQNLIQNALKYRSAERPKILIEAKPVEHAWQISVRDNGEGFDNQYAAAIFEPFRRVSGSDVSGSGIGLATCKRIIERLGGRIWAESVVGEGSRFNFTLPVERAKTATAS